MQKLLDKNGNRNASTFNGVAVVWRNTTNENEKRNPQIKDIKGQYNKNITLVICQMGPSLILEQGSGLPNVLKCKTNIVTLTLNITLIKKFV